MLTINGTILQQDEYYIRQLASGYDELIFSVPLYSDDYKLIQEEGVIREQGQEYLVKAIDSSITQAKIKAQINLNDWKAVLYPSFTNLSDTLANTVQQAMYSMPEQWTIQDETGFTFRRTVTLLGVTPLQILDDCRNTYGCTFRFDTQHKIIRLINAASYQPQGVYALRDFNLKALNYKCKTTGFATRLYAYGKEGMSFADINDGKPYVDYTEYCQDIICTYWSDERYTIKENLLEDAQAKIKAMGSPQQSFSCNIVDLASTNPEQYAFLDMSLFAVVTLIDDARNIRMNHQVVERQEYPHYPEKNVVTLSTITPRITTQVQEVIAEVNNVNSPLSDRIRSATSWLTGSNGGWVIFQRNEEGQPTEILIMDNPDPDLAQNVWRWNVGGLGFSSSGINGPYGTAITQDGKIVADYIKTGKLTGSDGRFELDLDGDGENAITMGTVNNVVFRLDRNGNLTISGEITATSGEIGGFSIDSNGNLSGVASLQVGSMTLKGNTISGLSSIPQLRLGAGNLSYSNYSGGTIYLLGMAGGQLQLCDLTVTESGQSTSYAITPVAPGGSPPSPTPTSSAKVILMQASGVNIRTGPGSSYPSVGTASSGQMYGGPNNDTQMSGNWAIVDRLYTYSDGKYVSSSLGGTYYISQTGSGKTFWNFTTIPV